MKPKVILIGQQKSCENYVEKIAPLSGLHVVKIIHTNLNNKIGAAIKAVKQMGLFYFKMKK